MQEKPHGFEKQVIHFLASTLTQQLKKKIKKKLHFSCTHTKDFKNHHMHLL